MRTKNSTVKGPVDPSFAYLNMSEEELKQNWNAWYPGGSGPLGAMRTICSLIEAVAHSRGFDVSKWVR